MFKTIDAYKPHHNFKDLSGQTFGILTAMKVIGKIGPALVWECRCECGKICSARGKDLTNNIRKSCGCTNGRHGQTRADGYRSLTYISYKSAKRRCENRRATEYQYYGGRGIEFRFTSINELIADIGERPDKSLSLDRIDNDGHYEVGNVRWATREQQRANQRPRPTAASS